MIIFRSRQGEGKRGRRCALPPHSIRLLGCLGLLTAFTAMGGEFTNDLIAHYRFETNSNDSLGKSPSFVFTFTNGSFPTMSYQAKIRTSDAPYTNGVLYVDGFYEPNGLHLHYLSTAPIDALSYESFTISMDFYPLPLPRKLTGLDVKLNSWTRGLYMRLFARDPYFNRGNILTGGSSYRWFGLNRDDNVLSLTLNNQSFVHAFKHAPVKPGRWHNVICSVDLRQRRILTLLDGHLLEVITLPVDFKLSVINSGTDAADRQFVFQNYSNGSVFYGYAAHLKIFGRALTESEAGQVYSDSVRERPGFPKPRRSIWFLVETGILLFLILVAVRLRGRLVSRSGGVGGSTGPKLASSS